MGLSTFLPLYLFFFSVFLYYQKTKLFFHSIFLWYLFGSGLSLSVISFWITSTTGCCSLSLLSFSLFLFLFLFLFFYCFWIPSFLSFISYTLWFQLLFYFFIIYFIFFFFKSFFFSFLFFAIFLFEKQKAICFYYWKNAIYMKLLFTD